MVVSYARDVLGQTGVGHFSPIGGYHPGRDLALVMDTARFKYNSHWVPVSLLWESMKKADISTGRSRGFFILRRLQPLDSSSSTSSDRPECGSLKKRVVSSASRIPRSIFQLDLSSDAWVRVVHHFCTVLPTALSTHPPSNVSDVIRLVVDLLPREVTLIRMSDHILMSPPSSSSSSVSSSLSSQPVVSSAETTGNESKERTKSLITCSSPLCQTTSVCQSTITSKEGEKEGGTKTITQHLEATTMFQLIKANWPPKGWSESESSDASLAVATLLLLAYPSKTYAGTLDLAVREELAELRNLDQFPPPLQAEILQIREQMFHLNHKCQVCNAEAVTFISGGCLSTSSVARPAL